MFYVIFQKKNDKCFDLSKKSALQPTKINTSLEVCMVKMILFKVCGLHHVILLSQSFRITTATLETGYWFRYVEEMLSTSSWCHGLIVTWTRISSKIQFYTTLIVSILPWVPSGLRIEFRRMIKLHHSFMFCLPYVKFGKKLYKTTV